MNDILSLVPKILGTYFYYPPQSEQAKKLAPLLSNLPDFFCWDAPAWIEQQLPYLQELDGENIEYHYSILFRGQGEMEAPPWGSVYLNKENLLMGESTSAYRQFLRKNQLIIGSEIQEPEDQFGLMLLALAMLLEQQQECAAEELLEKHLLPWAFRYLTRLIDSNISPFYSALGRLTDIYLQQLKQQLDLQPKTMKLYL